MFLNKVLFIIKILHSHKDIILVYIYIYMYIIDDI